MGRRRTYTKEFKESAVELYRSGEKTRAVLGYFLSCETASFSERYNRTSFSTSSSFLMSESAPINFDN